MACISFDLYYYLCKDKKNIMKKKCTTAMAATKKKATQYESAKSLKGKMSYLKGNTKK